MTDTNWISVKDRLEKVAAKGACYDNEEFMVDDYAGGDIDDAYEIGFKDGRVDLARELLGLSSTAGVR